MAGKVSAILENITPEEAAEAQKAISNGGMPAFTKFLKKKQDSWKSIPLNVGFIGNSGVGKSSTINSILGLRADENGSAEVGTRQTTTCPTGYSHPSNDKLIMWDLPGVGTPDYPRNYYFDKIGFEKYDFFLLLDAGRFREEDAWIGNAIKELGKDYFYIRTKIDNDVDNNQHDKDWDRDRTVADVLSDIYDNMEKQKMDMAAPVYLINNRNVAEYDFPRLLTDLVANFPHLKRGPLTLSLRVLSADMIHLKVAELRARIKWLAAASAGANAAPIPGVGMVADLTILLREITFYYNQLGLTQGDLEKLGSATGVNPADLVQLVSSLYPASLLTAEGIKKAFLRLPAFAAGTAVEEFAKYVPAIGTVVAAGVSFGTTAWFLSHSLNKMEEAATAVLNEALKAYVPY